MIRSFGDRRTEAVFDGRIRGAVRGLPPELYGRAARKLDMLNAARALRDLRAPPGNRLERLAGGYGGFHSIRVNDQWRIVFQWRDGDAHGVRITDYHG